MSEFLVSVLRIAYLALLWVFILFVANVIRTDIVGRRVPRTVGSAPLGGATSEGPGASDTPRSRLGRRRTPQPQALEIISGQRAGTTIPLDGRIVVGRGGDSTVPIDDDYASTQHAAFSQGVDGVWFVEDLLSTNGTYVNGQHIEEPTRLEVGDEVRIGRTVMTVTGGRG